MELHKKTIMNCYNVFTLRTIFTTCSVTSDECDLTASPDKNNLGMSQVFESLLLFRRNLGTISTISDRKRGVHMSL